MTSANGSAKKTASNCADFKIAGKIKINGTNKISLRKRASTKEIFASPKAKNVCWQAICAPKTKIPAKNKRIL